MSAVFEQSFEGIRPMRQEDIDAVHAVEENVYPFPWTKGIFSDCLLVGYSCWVYQQDEKIIGYLIMSIAAGEAHILTLAVDSDYQQQGYAKKFLKHAIDLARQRNAESIFLEVRLSNQRAINIYRKAGFREIGIRKNYYPDEQGRENAMVMSLPLA
ncbi:MAG: ribosomal protein S18-alanine N-acetyltransferase [Thioalkalispiraceae bacterium]|jgi:ribosomal-protein-alanine N-acetyltransferase